MKKMPAAKDKTKPALTRELVLRTALEILDENGVADFSMRNLGKRLGVEAMSLYNHVANKDDLIDGALDMVIGEIVIPQALTPWRAAMQERARSALLAFKRHPWASALMDSRLSSHSARLRYYDSIIGNLHHAGFSLEQAASVFSVLDSYVYGFIQQQLHMDSQNKNADQKPAELFYQNNPMEAYPFLAQLTQLTIAKGIDENAEFAFGLNLILDGIERMLL